MQGLLPKAHILVGPIVIWEVSALSLLGRLNECEEPSGGC